MKRPNSLIFIVLLASSFFAGPLSAGNFKELVASSARLSERTSPAEQKFRPSGAGHALQTRHAEVQISSLGFEFISTHPTENKGAAARGDRQVQRIAPSKSLNFDPQLVDRYPEYKGWDASNSQAVLRADSVWNNVDVVMHTMNGHFEFDVVLKAGSQLGDVWFEAGPSETIHQNADGSLTIKGANQRDALHVFPPYAFYADNMEQISASFIIGGSRIGFALEDYDNARTIIIDPQIVSSFQDGLGGNDSINAVLFTSEKEFLIGGGYSNSTTRNTDAVWKKQTRSGSQVFGKTWLAQAADQNLGNDEVLAVARAAGANDFWFGGVTNSSNLSGVSTVGTASGWLARANVATGSTNLGIKLVSGSGSERIASIALDDQGNVHVVGDTTSSDLPATGWDRALGGNSDAFYAVFNSSGGLAFLTYIGGSGNEAATDIAFDNASNKIYITGWTTSPNFVTTSNADQQFLRGGEDGFVLVVDNVSNTKFIEYASYVGGSGNDRISSVALSEGSDSFYVVGLSNSNSFPSLITFNEPAGGYDAVVLRGNKLGTGSNTLAGRTLQYARFYGGTLDDRAADVAVDKKGFVHVAGTTSSGNFPLVSSLNPYGGGVSDGFLLVTTQLPQYPLFSTYVGGSGTDVTTSLSVSEEGLSGVALNTNSTDFASCASGSACTFGTDSDYAVVTVAAPVHQLNIDLTTYSLDACPQITSKATVTDQHGFHYSGLSLNNFEVFVDGSEMGVSSVREVFDDGPVLAGLVLDYSGSMSSNDILNATSAAREFVRLMRQDDAGSITKFRDIVSTYTATYDKNQLLRNINSAFSNTGGTRLYDAMYSSMQALVRFGGSSTRALVVLTDGDDTGSSRTSQQVIDYALANGIRLFTIGLGSSLDGAILSNFASVTGGQYQNATVSADLTPLFVRALTGARESFYEITYIDSLLDGLNHDVELRANEFKWGAMGSHTTRTLDGTCLPTFDQALDISSSALSIDPNSSFVTAGGVSDARFDRDYAYSANISNNEESRLASLLSVPQGQQKRVSFAWRASTEAADKLTFFVDGTPQASISGETDWIDQSILLGSGVYTLDWIYRKDFSNTGGLDRVWLDYIRVVTVGPPPAPSVVSFDAWGDSLTVNVSLSGTGGGTISEYDVVCTNTTTSASFKESSSTSPITLNNLQTGMSYDCNARVRNEFGWSSFSSIRQTNTLEETPSGLPLWLLIEASK